MRPIAILFVLILAPTTSAHTAITDTLITMHDGQTVPRFASLPGNNLVVPAGETVTLPADTTFDAIEVSGTLKVSREYDTVCRFTNLQVLPGGTLDMGSTNDPVLRQVEFIVRNVAINTTLDPYQWGNGIFNLGTWTACGRYIGQTWTTMEGAPAGATTITVAMDGAANWQVGDELLIPDTRQMAVYPWSDNWISPRRESPVRIAAISGNVVTLTKPLDFEHAAAMSPPLLPNGDYTRDGEVDLADRTFWSAHFGDTSGVGLQADGNHDGEVDKADYIVWRKNVGSKSQKVERFKPYIANATRNIVIRSENPAGVRGHTVTTGDVAVEKLEYTALVGLGRTTTSRLNDSFLLMGMRMPGTNQVGRYVVHLHHVHTPVPSHHRGLFIGGSPKWGIVTHGTHDTKTEWCVVDQCAGSGIVTEDGPEVRNTFESNFVMGSTGAQDQDFPSVLVNGKNGVLRGQPGSEGAGFWFHGLHNRINGNVSINNKIGINFVHFGVLAYKYPSQPGGPHDTAYDKWTAKIIECNGNVTAANLLAGIETWDCSIVATHLDSWHNGGAQVLAEENGAFQLENARCLAQGWITDAVHSNRDYNWQMKIHNSRLEGCAVGCLPVRLNYQITNSTLHNKTNIDWRSNPAFPTDYAVNCLAVPGPGGDNFLIDWTYDETKLNLYGSPYQEAQQ